MDSQKAKQVAWQLDHDWVMVELPTHSQTYADYVNAITGLNVITDDADMTATIFAAVRSQVKAPGRVSALISMLRLSGKTLNQITGQLNLAWFKTPLGFDFSGMQVQRQNKRIEAHKLIKHNQTWHTQ